MTPSLVYQMKRRRLVSLMLMVGVLMVAAAVMAPQWQPAGPVFAEKVGDAVALVIVEPEDVYRISWRRKEGLWEETEAFNGRVTATMGGEKLVVFHGLSYTTYATGKDGRAPVNERWDQFTPGWSVLAAASAPAAGDWSVESPEVSAWAFGTLDGRTIASACMSGGVWFQGPELKRPAEVSDLVVATGRAEAWLWWHENGAVRSARLEENVGRSSEVVPAKPEPPPPPRPPLVKWGEVKLVDVPADSRLAAASNKGGPALYSASHLKKNPISVMEMPVNGPWREVRIKKDPPITAAIDSISVADGDPPSIGYASGMAAGLAFLDKDQSFEDLSYTLFRFRPGVVPWFLLMMFASFSIVGIGVSLLFERRKITAEALVEQVRMLGNVAPLMARAFAASVDTGPFLWVFVLLMAEGGMPATPALIGAISLCCAYHTGAEATWGQTLGKRLAGIAVRRTDGSPAELKRIVIRNMVRGIEMLLMFTLLPVVVMMSTKRSQRLGDLVAGTMVAKVEKAPQPEGEEA